MINVFGMVAIKMLILCCRPTVTMTFITTWKCTLGWLNCNVNEGLKYTVHFKVTSLRLSIPNYQNIFLWTNIVRKYMVWNGSDAMLAAKRSAGGTRIKSEVSVACRSCSTQARGSTLALKPRADVTWSPEQGYQWPHKKGLMMSSNFSKKNFKKNSIFLPHRFYHKT